MLYGTISYPGITLYDSFDFTDLVGVTPAVATIEVLLPDGGTTFPAANGDLVISSDGNPVVTLKYMHLDGVAFHQDSGGKVATIRLLDERWAWQFSYVTGHYNIVFPNGLVDPAHVKSPRQLAAICFTAIGVDSFDVSQLPNDARPECNWDSANAATELEKLADDLGCRIVCQRSTGTWRIVTTGVGNGLPDGIPYENPGVGISPKATPDFLRIVTSPFRFQVCFPLIAAGRDLDHSWKDLQDVSYNPRFNTPPPNTGQPISACAEFGIDKDYQTGIPWTRTVQPDGTAKAPREFAIESAFKMWRLNVPASVTGLSLLGDFFLPGYGNAVARKQIVVMNELVESWTDSLGVDHRRPAYIFGSYFGDILDGKMPGSAPPGMYPAGTRIDHQTRDSRLPQEQASFSIAIDDQDTDRTIITTSKQMMTFNSQPTDSLLPAFSVATLYLTCAVQVRDPTTWQPVRYEKLLQIGNGTNTGFCQTIIQDDIEPWTIQTYDKNGNPVGGYVNYTTNMNGTGAPPRPQQGNRNNKAEVDQMCDYYLNSYAQKFQIVATATRKYIGFQQIDMDGAICQVQWQCDSRGGSSTIASVGTEHNYNIPTFEQRLQRNATRSQAAYQQYIKYRAERRQRILGSNNTI